ncbi:MAG: pilus assembly protein [Myxococcales bacterium]|nr:pilus assembly protein [Myxococcales bacterium]
MVKLIDKSARKRRSKVGTTIVEATIVFPLMLMLIFGILEFGISFTRWNSLTNAVREGARVGVVFRTPCDIGTIRTLVETTVADFADSSGIDPASITTDVTGACGGTGSQLTVTSTVPYTYVAVAGLAGFAPSTNLSARTVMRNE